MLYLSAVYTASAQTQNRSTSTLRIKKYADTVQVYVKCTVRTYRPDLFLPTKL